LFYVPKAKVVGAFETLGIQIDYPDRLPESEKGVLAKAAEAALTAEAKVAAASALRDSVGEASIRSYVDRVRAALGALPQEIRLFSRRDSVAMVFEAIPDASKFLEQPSFSFETYNEEFVYEATYSDGTDFQRVVPSLEALRDLHEQIRKLASHMERLDSTS
jgi:hypothetical protein